MPGNVEQIRAHCLKRHQIYRPRLDFNVNTLNAERQCTRQRANAQSFKAMHSYKAVCNGFYFPKIVWRKSIGVRSSNAKQLENSSLTNLYLKFGSADFKELVCFSLSTRQYITSQSQK